MVTHGAKMGVLLHYGFHSLLSYALARATYSQRVCFRSMYGRRVAVSRDVLSVSAEWLDAYGFQGTTQRCRSLTWTTCKFMVDGLSTCRCCPSYLSALLLGESSAVNLIPVGLPRLPFYIYHSPGSGFQRSYFVDRSESVSGM